MDRKIAENIIGQLRDVQSGATWYDDNIETKIGQVSEEEAFIRPIPELHSVAELVSHIWVWRKDVLKRLQGGKSELTLESPDNWRGNDELRSIGWGKLIQDLKDSQLELVQFLAEKDDDYLANNTYEGKYALKFLAEGIIHHDLYHLGQIAITIKLLKAARK